jgi:hypothetical protein
MSAQPFAPGLPLEIPAAFSIPPLHGGQSSAGQSSAGLEQRADVELAAWAANAAHLLREVQQAVFAAATKREPAVRKMLDEYGRIMGIAPEPKRELTFPPAAVGARFPRSGELRPRMVYGLAKSDEELEAIREASVRGRGLVVDVPARAVF